MREIFVVRASGERIIFREFDGSRGAVLADARLRSGERDKIDNSKHRPAANDAHAVATESVIKFCGRTECACVADNHLPLHVSYCSYATAASNSVAHARSVLL